MKHGAHEESGWRVDENEQDREEGCKDEGGDPAVFVSVGKREGGGYKGWCTWGKRGGRLMRNRKLGKKNVGMRLKVPERM